MLTYAVWQEAVGRLLCRTPISAILIASAEVGRGGARGSTAPSAMVVAFGGGLGQGMGGEGGSITQRLLPTLLLYCFTAQDPAISSNLMI